MLNWLLELLIKFKLLIYTYVYYDFKIKNVRVLNGNKVIKISNRSRLYWDSLILHFHNIKLLEIEYYYNLSPYRIIYSYPDKIEYPIKINNTLSSKSYFSLENHLIYNDLFNLYAGPRRDFYNKLKLKDILDINGINDIHKLNILDNKFNILSFYPNDILTI